MCGVEGASGGLRRLSDSVDMEEENNVLHQDYIFQNVVQSKHEQDTSHKLYMWHDILTGKLRRRHMLCSAALCDSSK